MLVKLMISDKCCVLDKVNNILIRIKSVTTKVDIGKHTPKVMTLEEAYFPMRYIKK